MRALDQAVSLEMPSQSPQIHQFNDFSKFLTSYIAFRRTRHQWFSGRWITRRAGLSSPSNLSMLMSKKRPPSLDLVQRVCEALGLTADEARFAVLMTERQLDRSPILVSLVEHEMEKIAVRNGWNVLKRLPTR